MSLPPRNQSTIKKTQKTGRPSKTDFAIIPQFDSMEQMANVTGIPVNIFRRAKKEGCVFSHFGRCNLVLFLTWWFARDVDLEAEDEPKWDQRNKRAEALTREVKLQKIRDELIEFTNAETFIRHLVASLFFAELDRLAQEFPASLKGKGEVDIHGEVTRQMELIKKHLVSEIDVWISKKGNV